MIKAIVFDFGGVLMRTADPAGRREWQARLGLPAGKLEYIVQGSVQWYEAQHGRVSPEAYWQWVADQLNIESADLPQLRADYFRDDHLDLALIDLIRELRQQGYKVGLLSNDALTLEQKLRDELAIYDVFDAVIISASIGVMKPDCRAYEAIAQALDIALSESVFIDDNADNIDGAVGCGMQAIHYVTGLDVRGALEPILETGR